MQVEFTDQERQFILTATDQYVRATGLQNAAMGLVILSKINPQTGASNGAVPAAATVLSSADDTEAQLAQGKPE